MLSIIMIAVLVAVGTPVWGAIGFTAGYLLLVRVGQKEIARRKTAEASD